MYLIDELARGTNPHEGGALVLAIAQYLHKGNSIVLLTSHFEEIIRGGFNHLRIIGLDNLTADQLKKTFKGSSKREGYNPLGNGL